MTDEIKNPSTISISFENYSNAIGYEFYVEVDRPTKRTPRFSRLLAKFGKTADKTLDNEKIILFRIDATTGALNDLDKIRHTVVYYTPTEPD